MKSGSVWTAKKVETWIYNRFASGGRPGSEKCIVVSQLADGTGFGRAGWIDVAVFEMWPSNGLRRIAIEIKVNRQDFLREIANPNKNGWVRKSFHEFYYAAPAGIFDVSELPAGAGWIIPRGDSAIIKKASSVNNDAAIDDGLFAAILRTFHRRIHKQKVADRDKVLAESSEYKFAKAAEKAVEAFCKKYDQNYLGSSDHTSILKQLDDIAAGAAQRTERNQVLSVLDNFRDRILALFNIFAPLALIGMLDADAAGTFIIDKWGGESRYDREALEKAAAMRAGDRHFGMRHAPKILEELKFMERMARTITDSGERSAQGKTQ